MSILQMFGIYAKNVSYQCAYALRLPKLHITNANPPFAAFTQLDQHYYGYFYQAFNWGDWVPASLFKLEVTFAKAHKIAINITNAIQS